MADERASPTTLAVDADAGMHPTVPCAPAASRRLRAMLGGLAVAAPPREGSMRAVPAGADVARQNTAAAAAAVEGDADYNPSPQEDPLGGDAHIKSEKSGLQHGHRYVIVMVGLPARGKTHIAHKLARYLTFFHNATTRTFNVGDYRRTLGHTHETSSFFSADNKEGEKSRQLFAQRAMLDMKRFLQEDELGRVAIFDGTNTTSKRRRWILRQLQNVLPSKSHILWVESICNDEEIIDNNIAKTKLRSPDYIGSDPDEATRDFRRRIQHYTDAYETLRDDSGASAADVVAAGDWEPSRLSWVKLIDCGRQTVVNRIEGYLPGRIVQYLMTLHTRPRTIYLSRHGQSVYNTLKKIGGNSVLSEAGSEYARQFAMWVHATLLPPGTTATGETLIHVWTSSLKRTKLTASHLDSKKLEDRTILRREWRALDELYAGLYDGLTYEDIEAKYPEEFALRKDNKLTYRYPRGESYLDVIQRIDPVIHELERLSKPVVIVAHQGILRIIYAYFVGIAQDKAPSVSIPLHTVIKLTPHAYACDEEHITLDHGSSKLVEHDPPSH